MRHAAARRLAALAALLALAGGVAADSSLPAHASTSSDYDAGENATLMAQLTAGSPFANAVFTSTNLCTATCQQALLNMTKSVSTSGSCDKCTSNTGNSAITSWSTASTACGNCAARWNAYNASCNTPTVPQNKPCFNFQVIADGSNPTSLASLMTSANGTVNGDVYDFLSGFTSLIGSCTDAVDYVVNYALTTAYDPANGSPGTVCPTSKSSNTTCSAACNNAWNLIQHYCAPGAPVQYDFNGLPGGAIAQVNTFIPIEVVVNYILNGTAFAPNNDDYLGTTSGAQALPLVVTDPSCVVSAWMGQVMPDGSTSIDLGAGAPATLPPSANGAPPLVAAVPAAAGPTGAPAITGAPAMTCAQAAAAMNTSTSTGNCALCLADTGSPAGCAVMCPACGADFANLQNACGATGDSTLQLTYNLMANVWADNLLQVVGNFTFGDCYILAMTLAEPLAATCSDYFDYMTSYSQTNIWVNPNNSSQTGPACPTAASDTLYLPGTCPPGCQADLANLAGCNAASLVVPPGGGSPVLFATAWQQFVNGSYAAIDPFYNTFKTGTGGAAYSLSGCNSSLAASVPGLQTGGTVSNAFPAAPPNCSTARATLLTSSQSGACDKCSSNTGNPNNCFTSASGDGNCTLCGVQFDMYTAACNETYNDIGNTIAANLRLTTAGGDCFDMFNQIAQSSIGTANFDTDACSDAWDSIVQYSETVLNDGPGSQLGPNCPTQPGAPCSVACQNDLTQLSTYCTNTSTVQWAGFGAPGYTNSSGAPTGTTVSALTAWAYFVNGTATAPIGNAIVNGKTLSVPFALGNCTLPSWVPATTAAVFNTVTITGSFSINLPASMTLTQLYAKNAASGALEATIASSLGVSPNAVTILWAAMGVNVAGRRLLAASTIQYQVQTTQAGASAVNANLASFNISTLTTTLTTTLGISGASATTAPSSAAVAPAARVALAMFAAAAVATVF